MTMTDPYMSVAESPPQRVDGVSGVLQDTGTAGAQRRRAAAVPRQQQEHIAR